MVEVPVMGGAVFTGADVAGGGAIGNEFEPVSGECLAAGKGISPPGPAEFGANEWDKSLEQPLRARVIAQTV